MGVDNATLDSQHICRGGHYRTRLSWTDSQMWILRDWTMMDKVCIVNRVYAALEQICLSLFALLVGLCKF